MKISTRLTMIGAGGILTTMGVLTATGIWQGGVLHAQAQREVDQLVATEMARTTQGTYDLVRSQDQSLTAQVAHDQAMAGELIRQQGGFGLSPARVTWVAVNQFTHARRTVSLPKVLVGGRWLGHNTDAARATPFVDRVAALTGAQATVFQRLGGGDFLRVATTIRLGSGRRAVGTFIPAVNPNGTPNPVAASLGRGRIYRGNAFVVNAWYVSQYTPLFDRHGHVIGALYTGVKQEQVRALRQTILATRFGRTGTVRVLCGTGLQRGTYRIPPLGASEGQSVWQAHDGQGLPYIQTIIARALKLSPGESVPVRYLAPAGPGSRPAWHVAEVAYYRPWDWVIVTDGRADDFKDMGDRLRAGQAAMALTFLVLGLGLAGGAGWFLWRSARRISATAGEVAVAAERLAGETLADFSRAVQALGAGDLEGAVPRIQIEPLPVRSRDEIGAMATSFNEMQDRIADALAGLDGARSGLRHARKELVAANASLEERVLERTAALRETQERTRLAVEAAHLGTWDRDLDTGVHGRSLSAWQMIGYPTPPEGLVGAIWAESLHPEDRERVIAQFHAACAGTADYDVEYRVVWPDQSVHWVASRGQVQHDESGRPRRLLGVCRDITPEKELEAERERLLADALERADHCPLTGLLNHRAFHKRLEEEAARAERDGTTLAVAVLDLDNFKFFNDAYGHLAGDEVLRQVTRALQSICPPQDIVARYGGDEFAVLLIGADTKEAASLGGRLHTALADAGYRPPNQESTIPIDVCLGTAVYPREAATRLETLELADARLRRAKTGGDSEEDSFVERVHRQVAHSVTGYSMLDALVTAVDNKDRYTRRHSEDVLTYSLEIAEMLGLDEETRHTLAVAALLHDVGKIGVPDAILRKPGRLTDEEFEAVKQHPMMGAIMVGAVPGLEATLDAVRHHHERWDGGGYPFGLRAEEIPPMARLMAVADAYSAMTTDRPYRKGMVQDRALDILEAGAGTQWDVDHVRAFVRGRRARSDRAVTGLRLHDSPPQRRAA